jgi:hypothetical protein
MAGPVMLYTKNGSIPQLETDGTEGWIEAADKPECPEGKEVVWLNWEWVVRDPKPEDRSGYQWNWNHMEKAWVEGVWPTSTEVVEPQEEVGQTLTTTDLSALTTPQLK